MTAYSKTLNNMLNPFSNPASLSNWGSMVWGTGKWGYTEGTQTFTVLHYMVASGPVLSSAKGAFDIRHVVAADGPILSSTKGAFDIIHVMTADGPVLDSQGLYNLFFFTKQQTLSVSSDNSNETLKDENGFVYVYGNQNNAENRVLTTFTSGTPVDVTWVVGNAGSTVWS
jgi:hypothetical protein